MRTLTEQMERSLSPYAALSVNTKGRVQPQPLCELRTEYQRDRDKILHCKSFRRLKHKTQVFLSPMGDHYRTRLTHTLEVSQIARTISRALRLNEDLTEAIALGHDLGHTPFGHAGERVLNEVSETGFSHNRQSLRVVELLENNTGLNLTWEVRDGILHHTGAPASTMEGKVVALADRVAYINHDIDDAVRAGIITLDDLPKDCVAVLGRGHGERINTMVYDIVRASQDQPNIEMTPEIQEATLKLRKYLFDYIYVGSVAKVEEVKAERMIRYLFEHFCTHVDQLPPEARVHLDEFGVQQTVCDYIAGMTDNYAIQVFESIFIPTSWTQK